MSNLILKSKLIKACDYREVDLSCFAVPLTPDIARYERDLHNFLRRFAKKEETCDIAVDDMVTLSCSSDNKKFQREHITLRVGLGLFSRELEQKLIGMRTGETKEIAVGADTVMVTAEKILREVMPELTDQFAAAIGIDGIRTAEDIHTYCRFKQYDDALEEAADDACAHLASRVINASAFELDREELEITKQFIARIMNFGAGQSEDFPVSVEQMGESALKSAVCGQSIKTLTDEDYEAYLSKKSVALNCSIEAAREKYGMTEYMIDEYNSVFTDTLETYVYRRLKELGEKISD